MARLRLYVKEGCWLCDTAEEMLNGLRGRYDLSISTVDITGNSALYERFRFEIPVLELPDGTLLKGRIKKAEVEGWLDEHKE